MKKTLLTFFLFATTTAMFAQAESKLPEVLEVKETVYDFGKIAQGKPVYHEFEIANIGILPLKIDNVAASCGCTTPEWSKESIATGGRTRIKVGYNAAAEGYFEKEITIIIMEIRRSKYGSKEMSGKHPWVQPLPMPPFSY
jgi:hypothetical protein